MRLSKCSVLSTFVLLILLDGSFGGTFLFYFPFAAKSHILAVVPLVNELASRGHQVTLINSHLMAPNLLRGVSEIVTTSKSPSSYLKQLSADQMDSSDELSLSSTLKKIHSVIDLAYHDNSAALSHPKVQNLLASNSSLDVAVVPPNYCNEAGYFLAHKLNSSLVLWSTSASSLPWMNWAGGSPYNPSYMPLSVLPFTPQMTFLKRVINTMTSMAFTFYIREWQIIPKVNQLLGRIFPDEDLPDILSMERRASLSITVGNPFIADGLRPVLPNTILAGFMSCASGHPLSRHLKEWIEGAEHGVVYVSFGSVLKPQMMSKQKRQMFLEVLGSLKQRVILKWEGVLKDPPSNLLAQPWLPQKDILAHPNVKLFVTHGGAGSIQETICHKTPIVGIPIMADQTANLNEAVNKGFGIIIEWKELTKDLLHSAVTQVLEEDRYHASVSRLSDLVMDQPQHPLNTAVWWMEYVLRHPGNVDMLSHVHGLAWWQYFLIDVILAIAAAMIVAGWIVFKVGKVGWKTGRWMVEVGWRTMGWMGKEGWKMVRETPFLFFVLTVGTSFGFQYFIF